MWRKRKMFLRGLQLLRLELDKVSLVRYLFYVPALHRHRAKVHFGGRHTKGSCGPCVVSGSLHPAHAQLTFCPAFPPKVNKQLTSTTTSALRDFMDRPKNCPVWQFFVDI